MIIFPTEVRTDWTLAGGPTVSDNANEPKLPEFLWKAEVFH